MSTYTTEELENAFEFYDVKQMYNCGNHDDNSKSVRYQAWVNNSNLVKSSVEEYYYYLNNYGSVLTFNHEGNIVCDFDCATGISYSVTGSPKILLRIPDFKCKDPLSSREECCTMRECERLRILREEQARLRVPESERRRLREEREEQERQYMKEREEEMEEYLAWREENKFKPNPEMLKILAMQESARLQERERLREEEEEKDEEEDLMDMPLQNMNDVQIEKYVRRIGRCPRDECDKWTMVYAGGDIIKYSYCNFSQWHIEDQTVSNITITRAIFNETTFSNYVFDNVTFDECVFNDVVLNNTTFKNSKFIECVFKDIISNNTTFKNSEFIECELDSSMVPDKSCKVVNHTYDDDDDHIKYY